jgi:hypothetical protein
LSGNAGNHFYRRIELNLRFKILKAIEPFFNRLVVFMQEMGYQTMGIKFLKAFDRARRHGEIVGLIRQRWFNKI